MLRGSEVSDFDAAGCLTRRSVGEVHLALVAVYAVFVVWLHARSEFLSTTFGSFSDWSDYREVAHASVWSAGFWTGVKPAGYPLLVKALGEGAALHWAAVLISVVAWSSLALVAVLVVRSRALGVAAMVLVFLLSLGERIQVWNDLAGSESISISLLVLAIAAGLVLVAVRLVSPLATRQLHGAAWAVLAIALVSWSFTRDSNTYVLLMTSVVVVAVAAWRRRVTLAIAGVVGLVVCGVGLVTSDAGGRWIVPYDNVVFNRVLPDRDLAAAWRDAGMPDTPALRAHIREIAYHGDPALFTDPRLAAFRRWVVDHGRATYIRELVTRPSFGVGGPVGDLDDLLTSPVEVWGRIGGHSYAGSPLDPIVDSVFVPDAVPLAIWSLFVAAAAVFLVVTTRRSPSRGAVLLLVGVLVLAVPHLWLVWVGDAHNVARHSVTASVQFRLAGWLVLVLAADELLAGRRRNGATVDC